MVIGAGPSALMKIYPPPVLCQKLSSKTEIYTSTFVVSCQCSHTMQTSTLFETFFVFFKDFKRIFFLENTFLFLCYMYIFCTYIGTTIVLGIVHFARQNPPPQRVRLHVPFAHYSLGRLSNDYNNGTLKAMNVLVIFLPFFS